MQEEDIEKILGIAKIISESKIINKEKHFSKVYSHFQSTYPMLFDMCCSDRFDIETLKYMLNMMRKINNGNETEESASIEVGQKIFDKYVSPIVDKLEKQKPECV